LPPLSQTRCPPVSLLPPFLFSLPQSFETSPGISGLRPHVDLSFVSVSVPAWPSNCLFVWEGRS
jgi:hypothetical protein